MINKRTSLTVKHDDNSVFTDYSHSMAAFGRDTETFDVITLEDQLYVGFEKPINAIYVDIVTAPNDIHDTHAISTVEYWNGTAWAGVSQLSDDTLGLHRGGFIRWDREQDDQATNAVDSATMYWYKINPNEDRAGMVISGLNLVFSDDYELSLEQPYISDSEFLGSESSHIKTHAAVKREIIQKFRNKDYVKIDSVTGDKEDINCWDLHDLDEVRLAATYLAISKIYYQMSDDVEDVWAVKSKAYEDKFNKYINLARLSLDTNDDGVIDDVENKAQFKNRFLNR